MESIIPKHPDDDTAPIVGVAGVKRALGLRDGSTRRCDVDSRFLQQVLFENIELREVKADLEDDIAVLSEKLAALIDLHHRRRANDDEAEYIRSVGFTFGPELGALAQEAARR